MCLRNVFLSLNWTILSSFHSLGRQTSLFHCTPKRYPHQTYYFHYTPDPFKKIPASRGALGFVWSRHCPVLDTSLTGSPGSLAPASLPGPFRNALGLVIAFVGALSCTAEWNFPTSQCAGRWMGLSVGRLSKPRPLPNSNSGAHNHSHTGPSTTRQEGWRERREVKGGEWGGGWRRRERGKESITNSKQMTQSRQNVSHHHSPGCTVKTGLGLNQLHYGV